MLEQAEESTLTGLLGHLNVRRALTAGQRCETSDECLSDLFFVVQVTGTGGECQRMREKEVG